MTHSAQRVIVLADSSKLGREHLVRFAEVPAVDALVTDDEADADLIEELEQQGLEVIVA